MSKHDLTAFVMIIVGTDEFPAGLWIGLNNASGYTPLFEKGAVYTAPTSLVEKTIA